MGNSSGGAGGSNSTLKKGHVVRLSARRSVEVKRMLAEGGFATVYLVKDTKDRKQRFALKRLIVQSEEQEADALREIRVHKALGNEQPPPYLMPLLQSAVLSAAPRKGSSARKKDIMLLFPLFGGGALQDRILEPRDPVLNLTRCLSIFARMCKACEALHRRRIAHLDVKPGNILLGERSCSEDDVLGAELRPVLMDLGSAAPVRRSIDSRQAALNVQDRAAQCSSAAFRAPELWDCPSHCELDCGKADVWALGCTLYAMCFGKGYSPFEHPTQGLLLYSSTVKFPDDDIDADSQHLVRMALQRNPAERPSAKQMREEAERVLQARVASNASVDDIAAKAADGPISTTEMTWMPDFSGVNFEE